MHTSAAVSVLYTGTFVLSCEANASGILRSQRTRFRQTFKPNLQQPKTPQKKSALQLVTHRKLCCRSQSISHNAPPKLYWVICQYSDHHPLHRTAFSKPLISCKIWPIKWVLQSSQQYSKLSLNPRTPSLTTTLFSLLPISTRSSTRRLAHAYRTHWLLATLRLILATRRLILATHRTVPVTKQNRHKSYILADFSSPLHEDTHISKLMHW
jgi:hypothetical protein